MKEKIKAWFGKNGRAAVTLALVLGFALSLVCNYRGAQAFDAVIEDELRGIEIACREVVRLAERPEGIGDYEEVSRRFSLSVSRHLRALDHIAYAFSKYDPYDLNSLEAFSSYLVFEEDEAEREKNIQTVCRVAEELEFLTGENYDSDYVYNKKVKETLKNVEQLCADWLSDYDARNGA